MVKPQLILPYRFLPKNSTYFLRFIIFLLFAVICDDL